MTLNDAKSIENCALFKLSKHPGLEWFKHLMLIGSYQDQYAPYDSARIQICTEAAQDVQKGNYYI